MSGIQPTRSEWGRFTVRPDAASNTRFQRQFLQAISPHIPNAFAAELEALAQEMSPDLFWNGALQLAFRLEQTNFNSNAREVFFKLADTHLETEIPERIRNRAQAQIEALGGRAQGGENGEASLRSVVRNATDPRWLVATGLGASAIRFAGRFGSVLLRRQRPMLNWMEGWIAAPTPAPAFASITNASGSWMTCLSRANRLTGGAARVANPAVSFATSHAAIAARWRGEKFWLLPFDTAILPQLPGNWAVHEVMTAHSLLSSTSGNLQFVFSTRGPSPLWEGKEERYQFTLPPLDAEQLGLLRNVKGRWEWDRVRRRIFVIPDRVPAAALPRTEAPMVQFAEDEPVPLTSVFGEKFYLFYPQDGFPLSHAAYGQIVYIQAQHRELLVRMLDSRWQSALGDLHEFQYSGNMPFHENDRVLVVRAVEGAAGSRRQTPRLLPKPWYPFTLRALDGEEYYIRPAEIRSRKTDEFFATLRSLTPITAPGAQPYRSEFQVFLASFAVFKHTKELLSWVRAGTKPTEISFILDQDRTQRLKLSAPDGDERSGERLFYLLPVNEIPQSRLQSGEILVNREVVERIPRSPKRGDLWRLFSEDSAAGESWTIGRGAIPIGSERRIAIDDPVFRERHFRIAYAAKGKVDLEVLRTPAPVLDFGTSYGVWVREGLHHWLRIPEGVSYQLNSGQRIAVGSVTSRGNGFDHSAALVFRLADGARNLILEG